MNMCKDLIMIAAIIVFIVDNSGFVPNIKGAISGWLTGGKIKNKYWSVKPFDCSLCLTFWVGLIYLFCTHQFCLVGVLCVCLAAYLTTYINDLYHAFASLWAKIMQYING